MTTSAERKTRHIASNMGCSVLSWKLFLFLRREILGSNQQSATTSDVYLTHREKHEYTQRHRRVLTVAGSGCVVGTRVGRGHVDVQEV